MQAQRVKLLISLYHNDTISHSELQELAYLLNIPHLDSPIADKLEEIWNTCPIEHKIDEIDAEKIIAAIVNPSNLNELDQALIVPINTRRLWMKKISVAACLLIICLSAFFILKPKSEMKIKPIAANVDVKPGGQKAMLTLSDGTQIVLDGLSDGLVTQQGGTKVIKLANGQIRYAANQTGNQTANQAIYYNTMSTPIGGQYQLELPDGSKVWLNAASSIRYPNIFSGNDRRVSVTGEVYFEVAKNEKKPFIVAMNGGAEIKVLGTHFNVNTYSNESVMKTTLLEGSIRIDKDNKTTLLKPGVQAQIMSNGTVQLVDGVDMEEVVAWKNGNFHFKAADLPTVLRQIARWYDLEIEYRGFPQGENKFTGKIPMKVNLSRLIKWMEWSDVHFRVEGKKIIVLP